LLLATLVLQEKLIASRLIGALIIISGLVVIGGEGAFTFGEQGTAGDLLFVLAGFMSAGFSTLLRLRFYHGLKLADWRDLRQLDRLCICLIAN
jgi:drug/metabolite transporter (DMT)-like permease